MAELRSSAAGAGPGAGPGPAAASGSAARAGLGAGPGSLRAEQVAQTRSALVAAGRQLFGEHGFAATSVDDLARGFDAFLDAVLEPDVQRIIITDAPAVLGLARFTELDERYAVSAIVAALRAAGAAGRLHTGDPETIARLLLGALIRAAC